MLGHRRVSARNDDPVIGDVGPRCPNFLTIEHPVVAVTKGTKSNASQVGPGRRFRKKLAPDFLASQCGYQITLLLLL